jgi:uncharacterized protein (DUF2164 family)
VFHQLSFELTVEKIEAHFFSEIFSRDLENSYFELGVEFARKRRCKVLICFEIAFAKF